MLREHFPQVARCHWEEILPPELEEIYEPRHLEQEEDDDETETARALSEREKRELFRQHRNLGHPQPTELARALRHAGARREAIYGLFSKSYVVQRAKHHLYRCHPVQECYHAAYVSTSALALIWLT